MSEFTIYHNPRCSKSRQTLALLQDKGIQPEIIEYLKTPPSPEQLSAVLSKLGYSAEQLLRKKEGVYKELSLAERQLSDEELIAIMCEHPKLIERPIVIRGDQARVGRPPEHVLELM
jgi:arsenate reductase (glutaredoxin)